MSWRSTDEWPDDKYVLAPHVIEESLQDAARPDSPRPQGKGRRMRRVGMSAAAVIQVGLLVAMVLVPAGTFAGKPSSDPTASSAQTQTDAKGKSADAKAKKGSTETQTAPTADSKPGKGAEKKSDPTSKGNGGSKGKGADKSNKPDKTNKGQEKKAAAAAETTALAAATGEPTITSDKADYPPGAKVVLTGTNWQGDEPSGVQITVNDDAGKSWSRGVIVDVRPDGTIKDQFRLPDWFVANYKVTATGLDTGRVATTSFTDLSLGTYDQCSNDDGDGYTTAPVGCHWTNGNLQSNNSTYHEGDATVQRLWLTDLVAGSTHTVTLSYGTTKGGKHAYDYLTTWNFSENTSDANLCQDVDANGNAAGGSCTLWGADDLFPIPVDPNIAFTNGGPGGSSVPQPAGRNFTMRNGDITAASAPTVVSGSYAGDSDTNITITFTVGSDPDACVTKQNTTTCSIILWFGAHVALSSQWASGGAGDVSGSPYHVAYQAFDGDASGRRDNQMAATAIVPNTPSITTLLSDLGPIAIGDSVHDSATISGATATAGGTVKYAVYGNLTDCNAGTYATPGGTSAGSVTVTNGTVPDSNSIQFNSAGTFYWRAFYSGDANNTGPVSSTCTSETLVVSPNTPSITTLLSDLGPIAIGDSVHDSATISGATATAGGTVKYAVYGNLTDCNAGTYATPGGTSAGSVTVTNGTVPDSNSIQFNSAGTFYWRAFYSGDANNTGPVSSTCTSETLVVSPNTPSITTLLSDLGPIAIGDSVHDSATISGATATAGGTVKYAVYGNLTDCNAGTYATPGGTSAGSVTVTNGTVPDSNSIQFNSAGTFYWRAFYSGDANNTGPVSSTCTSETLVVSPNTPSITTLLSDLGPIAIGDSVHDSATISGATATAGGTVKYAVYGNLTDCNAGTYATPGGTSAGSVTVTNGTVPDSNSIQFNSAGTFYWRAFYSGDANNTGPVSSTCTSETLVVSPNTPSITTLLSDLGPIAIGDSVHDSATISGATATAGGTVKYAVYGNLTDCNAGTYATPGGTSAGSVTVTNGTVPDSNSIQFNSAGTFYWRAFYSGDANNTGPVSSTCTSETLVVSPNTPSITTLLSDLGPIAIGDSVHDSATISGATATAGGTVKYAVYGNLTDCNAGTYATPGGTSAGSVTVTNGTVPDSNSIQFNSAGTFYWRAFYSGDANNTGPVSSTCTSETLVVSPNTPSITTLLSDLGPIAIGDSVHDSATISGATATAGGTVKYAVYGNLTDCNAGTYATPGGTSAGSVTVTNGTVPDSNSIQFNSAGTFYWRAFYSGDANNTGPVSSTCTSETLVVSPNTPSITTLLSDLGPIAIGDSVHDSATISGATATAGGTVKYAVYGNLTDCNAGTYATPGGTSAGSVTVTNGTVPDSNSIQFNSAGTFYWRAFYSGDANNTGPVSSTCTSETLVVSPNTPGLTTTPSEDTGSIGDTLTDSATLSGSTTGAGDTIDFYLFAPGDDCSDLATAVYSSTGVPTNGDGTYLSSAGTESGDNTATMAGTYHWSAYYNADANNTDASSLCAEEPVVISPNTPGLTTTPSEDTGSIGDTLTDSATLSGSTTGAGDTIDFYLFAPGDDCSDLATAVYSSTGVPTNGDGTYLSSAGTESGDNTATMAGTYHWSAYYNADANNTDASSLCAEEPVVISPNTPGLTTTPSEDTGSIGDTLTDSATLSGSTTGAGDTIDFYLFAPGDDCSDLATAVYSSTGVPTNGDGTYLSSAGTESGDNTATMAGTYHWSAYYNADANNTDASSLCAEEPVVITTPGEGCTPGFWQGGVGASLWNSFHDSDWVSAGGDGFNPFLTTDKFTPYFEATSSATVNNMTMLDIVGSGGTNSWPRKAARDLIAAYLNASFGLSYPYSISTILADWHTAVTTTGTGGYQAFHTKYAAANQLGCTIGNSTQ